MSDQTQRSGAGSFGTPSQTGHDTDGTSSEYRDELTVQDESAPAGSSGIVQPSRDYEDTATGTRPTGAGNTADYDAGGSGPLTTGTGATTGSHHEMGDNRDGLGRDRTDRITADETGTLIAADKVQGTAVYDASGERLGTIDSLMLNKRSGEVAYAVMSFGGFLGIGERYHPLPWDKLTYDTEKGGYNIGQTQDELRAAPTYSRDELGEFDSSYRRGAVDDYYGRGGVGSTGSVASTGVPLV